MRFILCIFYISVLSGCQSFIAYQITQPVEEISYGGPDDPMLNTVYEGIPHKTCNTMHNCIAVRIFSHNDLIEYLTLSSLDLLEIKDSMPCDKASIPDEALISFGALIIKAGSIII